MRRVVSLLLVTVFAAGCLGAAPDADVAEADHGERWSERALASGHDHEDLDAHRGLTTRNFEIIGHEPLISEDYGTTPQGNLCGDGMPVADGRHLAVVESRGDVAFSIADVTDPAEPQWLGEFVMRTTYVYDVGLAPDGKHVVLITSQHKTPDRHPVGDARADAGIAWRSGCAPGGWAEPAPVPYAAGVGPVEDASALVPRPSAILLVDVSDPSAPVIVDHKPIPGWGHGVRAFEAHGGIHVVASVLACPAVTCAAPAATWHFYELVDGPAGGFLDPRSVFTIPVGSGIGDEGVRHLGHNDGWIHEHPVTGETLAYLVGWDEGLLIVNYDDPRNPRLVSQWTDHDPSLGPNDSGNAHSVFTLKETWDGRHYTILGPEQPGAPESGLPSGVIRVLDTTDPAAPVEVAAWVLPHEVVWEGRLQWSPHYLAVQDRTLFVSQYHGGVWALDLGGLGPDAEWHVLPAVGVLLPDLTSPAPPERPFRWTPTTQEVYAYPDGTLVTFESNSGLYAFRFDAADPMDPPEPWPLTPARDR